VVQLPSTVGWPFAITEATDGLLLDTLMLMPDLAQGETDFPELLDLR
jgi:hypothetical protein